LCTPAAVGLLAGAAGRLPLAPRIALRDTARNRAAAAPAVSAVLAAVAGCVALGAYLDSADARRTAQHEASLPVGNLAVTGAGDAAVAPAARAALPVRAVVSIREVACGPAAENTVQMCAMVVLPERLRCPQIRLPQPLSRADQRAAARDPRCAGTPYSEILSARDVAGGPAVGPLTGATGADLDRAAAVLAAGGVVLADERYVRSGAVTIEYTRPTGAAGEVTVPAYVLRTASLPTSFIISPGALARLGLTARPSRVVIDTTRPPTQAELDSFRARLGEGASVFVERAPQGGNNPLLVLLGAVAGVIALGAAGIATGLAAADGRRDLATLAAVGASPGVRRLLSLSQAGAIAGLGTALGVVTGLVIAMAVLAALNQTQAVSWPSLPAYPLLVPWASLAVVVLGPLVAMLGAGLLTRSRLPVERRAG
ncbi:MAG TPA: ABC transporter permease, partial [Pilimelia sp.]|nr:ABC transporter permease [Pilimelia sp.]